MAQALLVILVQVGADISSNYQQQHEEFYLINIGPEHVKLSQEKQQITLFRLKIDMRKMLQFSVAINN